MAVMLSQCDILLGEPIHLGLYLELLALYVPNFIFLCFQCGVTSLDVL